MRRAGLGLVSWLGLTTLVGGAEGPPAAPPVRMEEVEIRGEVERPEVFYIIPRRPVELDVGPRSKDYRSEILDPLLPRAFEEWVRGGSNPAEAVR